MSTIGLYLRKEIDQPAANALRARLNDLAGDLGYTAVAGPTAGGGNLPRLLQAIDAGEVALVRLSKQSQNDAAELLWEQAAWLIGAWRATALADALIDIADALKAAADRASEAH